jgi:RNA polymerase sigma factor (sigma-70 family)
MPTSPTTRVLAQLRSAALLRDDVALGDGELLSCFVERRDEAAFDALVHRHGGMVWGVCRRLLSHHDAEDAFQATFLVLVRKAASVVPRAMVGNFLYGVAHQAALQARRAIARRRAREVQVTVMPDTEAVQQDQWSDVQPLLDQELSRLPDNYRAVIVLCDLEGRTRKEAARQLGVPEGTVAGRLARARALLAKRLALSGGALAAVFAQNVGLASVPDSVVLSTIRAASLFAVGQVAAGPVSVKAVALTQGVLKTMMMSKLKAVIVVALLAAVALGGGVIFHKVAEAQTGQLEKRADPVKGDERPNEGAGPLKDAVAHAQTRTKLNEIGRGMLAHFDDHQTYPGPALYGKDGKPLLSWRVALLPYLDEGELYKQFRLDEPWDSEHNRQLLAKIPALYRRPGAARNDTTTPYQVFAGQGTIFEGPKGLGYRDIPDGIANTILVVEAAAPVPWTKPEDLPYSATGKIPELGSALADITYALFADGKVHALKRRFDPDALRLAITRDDGIPTPFARFLADVPILDKRDKEGVTAWGKEVGGLQAGLGYYPGQKRAYSPGETVKLVVRVRNVSKEEVKFQYLKDFFIETPPIVTDDKRKPVPVGRGSPGRLLHVSEVELAPGKEIALAELKLEPRTSAQSVHEGQWTLFETGKFSVQYEQLASPKIDEILGKLATGKLELEIKSDPLAGIGEETPQKKAPEAADMKPIKIRVYIEKVNVDTSTITASCMLIGEFDNVTKPLRLENLRVAEKARITARGKEVKLTDLRLLPRDTHFYLFLKTYEEGFGFEVVGIETVRE